MKEFAKSFYKSQAWKHCRDSYIQSVGGLCERCLKRGLLAPGVIVHHKCYINESNIKDTDITLNYDNLELLCRFCHAEEHSSPATRNRRFYVDENNKIQIKS